MTDAHQPDATPAAQPPSKSGTSRSLPTAEDTQLRRELRGVVERITYHNAESGYTIARLSPERHGGDGGQTEAARGEDRLVTVVGTLADLTPGEAIVAQGWWMNDHRYGWQFKVLDYRTTLPATIQGMRRYLGSGLVRGVGPKMAGRIVDAFGDATFDVIDSSPGRLTEVPGIGRVRSERIAATWEEQRHIREVMAALSGYGVSTSLAVRIYKRFGDDSARVVGEEPYRLAREVWGIGFKTADTIARAVGIPPDAPERLQAGVLHAFAGAGDEGHTLLPQGELVTAAAELLQIEHDGLGPAIAALLESGDMIGATREGVEEPLLALAPFARAESNLAGRLRALAAAAQTARAAHTFAGADWARALGWLRERHQITLAPEQEDA
ncbi:MAG: helix-hairpin-helix domain-containing protein, partial [Chloroflexota bacterium]|nr:helix-hairpin-helix domain-containing protein [Chloroflexota bacterium]